MNDGFILLNLECNFHFLLATRFLLLQGLVEGDIERTKTMMRQCFPLYTLLLALGSPTVDFLSLDVEVLL